MYFIFTPIVVFFFGKRWVLFCYDDPIQLLMRNNFARHRLVLNQRKLALDQQNREQNQLKLQSFNVRLGLRNMHQSENGSRQVEKGKANIKPTLVQAKFSNPHKLIEDIIQLNKKESFVGGNVDRTMYLPSKNQSVPQSKHSERETKRCEWQGSAKQSVVNKMSTKRSKYDKQGNIIPNTNIIYKKPIDTTRKRLQEQGGSKMLKIQNQEQTINIQKNQSSFDFDQKQLLYRLTNDKFNTFSVIRKAERGQAELKFREKLKIKLSRRHMYHTLKHKSEVLNKIKPHSYSFTKKEQTNPEQELNTVQICRVHDRNSHTHGKNLPVCKNMTVLQNLRQLRIDSKRMMCQVSNDNKVLLNIQTFGNSGESKKTNIEIYQQIMASIPLQVLKCRKTEESQCRRKTEYVQENVFRELTPWRPWQGEDNLY